MQSEISTYMCFDTVGGVIWPIKTRPRYDLQCLWWDVKPYSTSTTWHVQLCMSVRELQNTYLGKCEFVRIISRSIQWTKNLHCLIIARLSLQHFLKALHRLTPDKHRHAMTVKISSLCWAYNRVHGGLAETCSTVVDEISGSNPPRAVGVMQTTVQNTVLCTGCAQLQQCRQ